MKSKFCFNTSLKIGLYLKKPSTNNQNQLFEIDVGLYDDNGVKWCLKGYLEHFTFYTVQKHVIIKYLQLRQSLERFKPVNKYLRSLVSVIWMLGNFSLKVSFISFFKSSGLT